MRLGSVLLAAGTLAACGTSDEAAVDAASPSQGDSGGAEGSGGSGGSGGPLSGPGGDLKGPYMERTLGASDGTERVWLLRLPAGYKEGMLADVVFSFHGAGSNALAQFTYSDFMEQADRDGVILVMPNANDRVYADETHRLAGYWSGAWEANLRERDFDIDHVLELVDLLRSEYNTGDFFATGMSAGGDMVSALACFPDSPFKAYGPVTYMYYNEAECGSAPPRPFIYFHGTEDATVPIQGSDDPWNDPPVSEAMQRWADHNGCEGGPTERAVSDEVTHISWAGCDASTEWYRIEGGGHTWPGAVYTDRLGYTTDDISASDLIWEVFHR
ncbi:MAG TPA: hypothetical protein QGG47_09070 [Acidobacteriota bacterium]|nr:hypothetical protein [Acidobacteriota bacterium]